MTPAKTPQTMKPATAAKKLGVLLDATPADFQQGTVSRTELDELLATPPEWVVQLRLNGPHPRQIVASKLGVTISGLARGGVTEPLTTAEIQDLLANRPEWLVRERATQAEVRREAARVKQLNEEKARKAAHLARQESQRAAAASN
ncbi:MULTISPECIES: DUF5997 family protein [Agreia]|uniref:Uncharacterized protein n=1 Tax=Agreia pratensis TaxID=150121 RepID=A0A1X7JPA4_9MICO|nr:MULTISPECIES: DUF5997 family protein [Microbacteriaceae]KQM59741.1 hypothetical protein ASE64_07310 [Agreia sp. Leaf210]KQR20768.1 hypothetical protein ASF79_13130 [Agreia sp. Leaf335]PPF62119.1 hypothetical protein C5E11_12920 [Clavibacter michiganensis]SMG30036.1 hypothetical protein SAMN06296010_1661 [Agreia pratensis]